MKHQIKFKKINMQIRRKDINFTTPELKLNRKRKTERLPVRVKVELKKKNAKTKSPKLQNDLIPILEKLQNGG